MMRMLVVSLALACIAGCDFFAPVVATFPTSGMGGGGCQPPPECSQLDEPPPPVNALPERFDAVGAACGPGLRRQESRTVTSDTTLDASQLGCVDLDLRIDASTGAVVVSLEGDTLSDARISLSTRGAAVSFDVGVTRIRGSELHVDGSVVTTFEQVEISGSRLSFEAPIPYVGPLVLVEGGALVSVEVAAPRAVVRLRSVGVRGAAFTADSLVLDRGEIDRVVIEASLVEVLAARLEHAELSVGRLVAAGGFIDNVNVIRCGSISLSQLDFSRAFVAACDEPVDVVDVGLERCTILGDLVGARGALRHSVFGGANAMLEDGEITDSAFCGAESVDARLVDCIRCEPSAPQSVCGVDGREPFCPGLCSVVCAPLGQPALSGDACMP